MKGSLKHAEVEDHWLSDRDDEERTKIRKFRTKTESDIIPHEAPMMKHRSHFLLEIILGKTEFPRQMCGSLAMPPPCWALSVLSAAAD